MAKETWASKLMMILAIAGGAVGLGNFLRFPTLFAQYGGWFLVPYFISFFILGLPLMYVEWTLGIMARDKDKHSLYTLLNEYFPNKKIYKFIALIAIVCCLIIGAYYVYMESWMLGYSIVSLKGVFNDIKPSDLHDYLSNYISFKAGKDVAIISIVSLVVSIFINMYLSMKDISKGIGKFINVCMPLLGIMCIVLLIKVFFTDNISQGLKYMMRGKPTDLLNIDIWIAAASQMFFSLSVGFTSSMVYVSYAKDKVNIKKDGFSVSNINMLTEVFLASFLSIPIGFLAFGAETTEIAKSSTYCFGMVAMPSMFQGLFMAPVWCFLWFFLLFIAALLSSLSIFQVFVSYLSDLFNMSKVKSVVINMIPYFILMLASVVIPEAIDEFDFWTNTIILPILALFLIFLIFKFDEKYWKTFNENNLSKVRKFGKILIKYITPTYILVIIIPYIISYWQNIAFGKNATYGMKLCRMLIVLATIFYIVIHKIYKQKHSRKN